MRELAVRARAAARDLAPLPRARKDAVLRRLAAALRAPERSAVLDANAADVADGEAAGLGAAMLDRLRLDEGRLDQVAQAVDTVAALPDPVGEVVDARRLPNGLQVGRMRVPLGVVGLIYESRPNVTVDAAALCLKSGNACILRGGKEAFRSNQALAALVEAALREEGLDPAAVTLVPTTDRAATRALLGLSGLLDVVIPRGGEGLIRFVTEHARVPVLHHAKGVCHVYVHGDADLDMAEAVVMNAKTQRPGVCNAAETLLVDRACAERFLPRIGARLHAASVAVRADEASRAHLEGATPATPEDWDAEYLDLILAVRVVDGLDGALAHVRDHGSQHTEAIVTESYRVAERWLREVDASLVLVNASTRFNDGGELGLGAEMGVSTTKLHAYGPMGLAELCTLKWIARGEGQLR